MKSKTFTRSAGAVVVFGFICAVAACLTPPGGQNSQTGTWYSVVPPILAILLAFLTHHVLLSLGIAIVVGGLLIVLPQSPLSTTAWFEGLKTAGALMADTVTSKTNLQILAFIPPIFVMIEVVIASGGFKGIILWLLRWVKGRKSAQMATALMGVLCFIDDYTNAIIVGSMMQPITDRFRVSREKLAFLVDATSAPIAGLAVVSTWIAYEVGLFSDIGQQLGIDKSGYAMFFDALSFRFYCLLMIVFVFVHILTGQDFGPMKDSENLAKTSRPAKGGETSSPKDAADVRPPLRFLAPRLFALRSKTAGVNLSSREGPLPGPRKRRARAGPQESARAVNALLPLAGLIIFHLTGLWVDGDGPAKLREGGSLLSWVYWREVIGHAQNSPLVLACAALFGLTLALLCARLFGSVDSSVVYRCFCRGISRAAIPIVILILAWSLKNCCDRLRTAEFLTTILAGRVSPYLFPPILFLVACGTSFATGTSYGTMAILIPTAVPIAFALDGQAYGLTTMISLGAVLDGAIFGDHCSPISDTTIMSSIASSCDLIEHVRTQLPYSLFIAGLALLCAYLPSALGLAPRWSFTLAVLIMGCVFALLTHRRNKRRSW